MVTAFNRYYYKFFWPTSTKPQAWILRKSYNGCSFGRHGVLKRDRIPLLKSYRQALEKNVVSLESSMMTVTRRPISCTNSIAMSFHVPAVSMAMGQKMCVLAKLAYVVIIINYKQITWHWRAEHTVFGTVEDGMRAVIDEIIALLYAGLVTNGIIISQKPYTHSHTKVNLPQSSWLN